MKFIWEEIICYYSCPIYIIIDRGPKNKEITEELLYIYNIQKIKISVYYLQANNIIEVGYKLIKNCFYKLEYAKRGNWVSNIYLIL